MHVAEGCFIFMIFIVSFALMFPKVGGKYFRSFVASIIELLLYQQIILFYKWIEKAAAHINQPEENKIMPVSPFPKRVY